MLAWGASGGFPPWGGAAAPPPPDFTRLLQVLGALFSGVDTSASATASPTSTTSSTGSTGSATSGSGDFQTGVGCCSTTGAAGVVAICWNVATGWLGITGSFHSLIGSSTSMAAWLSTSKLLDPLVCWGVGRVTDSTLGSVTCLMGALMTS